MYRFLLLLPLLLSACNHPPSIETPASASASQARITQKTITDDYLLKAKLKQSEPLAGVQSVIIRCVCAQHEIVRDDQSKTMELMIEGETGSLGYHGEQTVPDEMMPEELRFSRSLKQGTLLLQSPEWSYMHHFKSITGLKVRLPSQVSLQFVPMSEEELYQRSPFSAK